MITINKCGKYSLKTSGKKKKKKLSKLWEIEKNPKTHTWKNLQASCDIFSFRWLMAVCAYPAGSLVNETAVRARTTATKTLPKCCVISAVRRATTTTVVPPLYKNTHTISSTFVFLDKPGEVRKILLVSSYVEPANQAFFTVAAVEPTEEVNHLSNLKRKCALNCHRFPSYEWALLIAAAAAAAAAAPN